MVNFFRYSGNVYKIMAYVWQLLVKICGKNDVQVADKKRMVE